MLDRFRRTPLRIAVGKGAVDVVVKLLQAGAGHVYTRRMTPSWSSECLSKKESIDLFKAALWNSKKSKGEGAIRHGTQIIDMLLAAGWDQIMPQKLIVVSIIKVINGRIFAITIHHVFHTDTSIMLFTDE